MLELENNENPPKDKGYKPKSSDEIFNDIYKDKENLTPGYKPGIGTNIDINKATEDLGLGNRPELGTQFLQERIKQIESQKIYDTAKKKADEQGFFGELVGFTAQVAAGAVGGTLEGLGALFDPNMIDTMEADSQSFGKMLSDWGTKLRELGTEYGVQVNPEAKEAGFAPWSREWWLSGAADATGSVLGFLIPVAAEAKALSAAGTALQGINALGKAGKFGNVAKKSFNLIDDIISKAPELTATEAWATDGIHKAIVSRHMESTMEAKQVFDEEYKKFIDAGKSEQEARALAAEGAAFTYRGNWGMLISDIPQYLLMLRGPKLSKVVDDVKLAKVAGTSEGLARIEGIKKYLIGISSEAGEEAYQFVISEEAKHSADVKAGIVEDNDFGDRMSKYSKDANLWSSALFGGLGGGVFQAAGPKVMEGVNKYLLKNSTEAFNETANRIAEFTSRKETILKNVATRQEAVLSGDEDAIKAANKQMAYDIGINAAKVGNLDLALDGLDQLKNLSTEERKQYGLDDDFINNIEETKKNIQLSAELWQDNYRRYGSESAESISIREFHLKNYNTELPTVKQKVDELINNLPRIGEVTIHGKNAMEAKLNLKAAERTLKILNWKSKNQKISTKAKESIDKQIEELGIQITNYKDALDNTMKEFSKEFNDADKLVLKTLDGKMGEDLTKAKSTQNLYNNQIHQLTEELNFLTSQEGQKVVQEEIKKQAEKVVKQRKKEEVSNKYEQEEQELAGEETGPDMSISELDAMIKAGDVDENILDAKAKQALKDYRAGLTPDKNLQPENENTTVPEVENTEEKTRDVKEEIKNTSKASNTDGIFATPENAKGIEDLWFGDDKSLNIALKTPNALAWFSYYNTKAQEKDKTKANKALADFLEGPYDLKNVTIRFGIDFEYLEKYKNKDFPEIRNAIANKSIPQLVGQLPVYAILEKDGKPIEHEGEQLKLHLHDDVYSNFDDSIKEIAKAQIIDQKTQILKAFYEGKTLTSKVLSESNGHINVAYTENREMSKNSLKDISSDPTKIEFMYGSNDFYLTPKGDPILDLPASKISNGAIYAKVKTANGSNFPLRLHAENLSRDEAYVVYRLALEILKDSNKATENISKDIIDGIANAKNPVLSQMTNYLDLNNMTNKQLLDHFVFNGYQKTKNTGDSKLYIIPQGKTPGGQIKPGKIVYGAKADYTLELFNTSTARERFINHLQKARRRQVDVNLLDNPEYKKYLVENQILTSNAVPNEKGRLFFQPTITYDTNFTLAETKLVVEAKKADIERRRQEELNSSTRRYNITKESNLDNNNKIRKFYVWESKNNSSTVAPDNIALTDEKALTEWHESQGHVKVWKEEKVLSDKAFEKSNKENEIDYLDRNKKINAKYDAELVALNKPKIEEVKTIETNIKTNISSEIKTAPNGKTFKYITFHLSNWENSSAYVRDAINYLLEETKNDKPGTIILSGNYQRVIENSPIWYPLVVTADYLQGRTSKERFDKELENLNKTKKNTVTKQVETKVIPTTQTEIESDNVEDINPEQGSTIASLLGNPTPLINNIEEKKVEQPKELESIVDSLDEVLNNLKEDLELKEIPKIIKHVYLNGIHYLEAENNKYYVVPNTETAYGESSKEVTKEALLKPFRTESEWNKLPNRGVVEKKEIKEGDIVELWYNHNGDYIPGKRKVIIYQKDKEFKKKKGDLVILEDSWNGKTTGYMIYPNGVVFARKIEGMSWTTLSTATPLEIKTISQEDNIKEQRRKEALKRKKDGNDSAFKSITFEQLKAQYNKWNYVDNEVKHIRQLLPKAIGINVLADDYVEVLSKGQFAIGLFTDNMITLAEKGPKGVAYHEAFHAVYRTMLSEKEQKAILADAVNYFELPRPQEVEDIKKLYKIDNHQEALDLWYEEKLADEFERFMGEPQVEFPGFLKNLFERLKAWLKNVFSNKQTVKKLFRDIQLGKYKNKPVKLSKGVAYKTLISLPTTNDTFSPEEIKEITQQLTFAALKDVKDINDLEKVNIDNIKDELYNLITIAIETNNEELEDRVNKVLNNFTYFVNETMNYLGLVMNLEESEELVEDNDGNLIPKSSYEVSGKVNASKNIKFLIALTPRFKSYDIRTNKKEYDTQGTYLGLPRFSDFGNTWNKLEKNLAGIVPIMRNGTLVDSFDLMLERLEKLSKYHPELGYISNTLRSKDNTVKTQFNFTFSRFKGNYLDHLISGNPGSMTSKISNADSFRKEKAIANTWAVNMSKALGEFQDQKLVYSPEKLDYLKNVYAEMRKSLAKDSLAGVPSARTIQLLDGTLHLLGINIKPEALTKWVDEEQVSSETPEDKLQIAKITNFVLKLDKALIADKTNSIFNRRGDINGRLSDNKTNNHILDQRFFHTELASHAAEFEKVSGESTIIGPDGNKIWIYQDNNLISKTISAIKAGDNTYLDLLAQTPYAQNSLWAKWLRDNKNAQKFDIDVYGNYKEEGVGDSGDKASDLKDPDKFNDIINKYLAGVYIGLAEADKSQQYYLTGPELQSSQVSINPSNGQPFYDNTSAKSVTILYNYFADEMNRMVHAYNQLNGEDKLKPEQQIMYYHFGKTPGDGKGNCFKSYLFPNMDLEAMGLMTEGIPKTLTPDNDKVRRYIEVAFLDLVKRDLEKASEFGIIARDGAGYKNRTIDSNLILNKYNGNVGKAIADYTLNSIIANIEQTKLFNGDPALYKAKGDGFEDFRKRIPAAIASGKDIRIFKNDNYEVRSHYTSAVVENIETPSSYFSNDDNLRHIAEITKLPLNKVKSLFKPYLSVNQTDAQAWITLDAYKERMVGYGKWSNKHEDAFRRIKAFKMLPQDITLFAQPVKTVHAEMKYHNGVMTMQYNKQSEAVLLPDVVKDLKIEKLLKAMESQSIDHVIVLDGKKAGAIGVAKITDENGNILDDIKLNGLPLSYRHLMLQQDLPTKRIKDTIVGSQPVKNVLAVLDFTKTYGDQNGQEVFEEYHTTISKLSDIGLVKVHKEFGYNPTTGKKDLNVLYKTLDRLFKGEVSNNISNAFKGKLPIEAIPQIRKRVQNKINSYITKKTVKLKQLGGAMIQLSNFGWITSESNIKLDDTVKDGIIWFRSPNSELNPARLKDGKFKAAQVLIPHSAVIDTFNSLKQAGLIKKNYKDMTHNELKALIDPQVLKGLSYRIPNQGPASNDVFDIVGILPPEMGDTMIAFKEITTKTGSDFDIDKAFIILPNFRYDETTNKIVKVHGTTEQGLQNRRLELMQMMLSHPEAYAQMMAPLDDPWLKDLCAELFPETNKAKDLNFFTGTSQMETKSLFDNAKNLVGVIANHMSHHNLTKHDGLYYNDYNLGKGITKQINVFQDQDVEDFNPSEFTNYSGAAIGGDKYWEAIGKKYEIGKQVNYRPEDLSKLTKEQLEEVEKAYKQAVKDLGRKELEKGSFAGGLVRRDYLQAKAADTIFAISAIVKPGEKDKKGYVNKTKNEIVEGGTGYAVQMAINLGKEVFVFDQNKKQWFKPIKQVSDLFGSEETIVFTPTETPTLTKKFAGIGTRELNENGKKAIESVYAKSFSSKATDNPIVSSNSLLSVENDENGNSVEITLGAYMNAIVDAAKDPFISRANINQFTAPTAFMLTRAGLSREWITAFIGQPILVDLVAEVNKTEGRISDKKRDFNGKIITALDKILSKYGSSENSIVFKSKLKERKFKDVNKITFDSLKNTIKGSGNVPQLQVLAQFLEWQLKAKELNDLVKACKADTNGATKNLTSARLQDNLLKKLVRQGNIGNLDKLIGYTMKEGEIDFNGTRMIGTYHKNSVNASQDIFEDTFMTESPAFLTSMYTIAQSAGYPFLQDVQIADTINDELYAAIASESSIFYSSKEEINKLLYGKGAPIKWGEVTPNTLSLADRVLQAKDVEEFKDNLFIQSLDVRPGFNNQPSLLYLSPKNLDKDAKDNMFLAWEDVLELDKQLGEDLIRYAYYSSGFKNSFGTFYEHIPVSWMVQSGYSDFISQKMKALSNPQETAGKESQIFKHLYENNELVQHAPQSLIGDIEGIAREHAFTLNTTENPNLIIGFNANGKTEMKRFLKIVTSLRNDLGMVVDTKTSLYKLAGYSGDKAIYVRTNKLGYSKGGLIIKEYGGDGNTSIFEENNVTLPQEVEELLGENLVFPEPIITEYTVIEKKQKSEEESGEDYNICKNRE